MKGFHVVFGSSRSDSEKPKSQIAWSGHSADKLRDQCRSVGMPEAAINDAMALFTASAFPEGEVVIRDVNHDPHPCPAIVTAFRETNVGQTKDLEGSVLWRAILSLNSVMESARERAGHLLADDLQFHVDTTSTAASLREQLRQSLEGRLRILTVMHPVIVTDAQLWLSGDGGLQRTDWARFVLQMPEPAPMPWFDIVQRGAFDSWAAAVTEHYRAALEHPTEAGLRRSAESLSAAFDALMMVTSDPRLDMNITVRDRVRRTPVQRIRIRAERVESN